MSDIGKQFISKVFEKAGEADTEYWSFDFPTSAKNIVPLRKNYNCNIYYLTSQGLKKLWWGFGQKQINELKQIKIGFVVVFLFSSEEGYIVIDKDIDEFSKELSIDKNGNYKVDERYLPSRIAPLFRSLNEFFEFLLPYRKDE